MIISDSLIFRVTLRDLYENCLSKRTLCSHKSISRGRNCPALRQTELYSLDYSITNTRVYIVLTPSSLLLLQRLDPQILSTGTVSLLYALLKLTILCKIGILQY